MAKLMLMYDIHMERIPVEEERSGTFCSLLCIENRALFYVQGGGCRPRSGRRSSAIACAVVLWDMRSLGCRRGKEE